MQNFSYPQNLPESERWHVWGLVVANAWLNNIAGGESSHAATVRTRDNIARRRQRRKAERPPTVRFAHPAETAIARLFDSFGVPWLYEPTTFPLITSQSGLPVQSFTPDFFLPDQNVYIEMTTMRQSLVTRKNRKFRLMRELYPHVDVRLLYRKDVELIMAHYYSATEVPGLRPGPVVATCEQIARKADDLAALLAAESDVRFALIALGAGAETFRDAIAAALELRGRSQVCGTIERCTVGEARAQSFHLRDLVDLRDREPVLVADVVGTGLTADSARRWFSDRGTAIRHIVALFDRRSARLVDVPIVGPALPAPSAWISGTALPNDGWVVMTAASHA
jgi:hypoxanthine phosphoribosyltransferase